MIYGYARVSTATQGRDGNSLEEQTASLEKYGCQEIITEAFSGKTMERPQFQSLLWAWCSQFQFEFILFVRISRNSFFMINNISKSNAVIVICSFDINFAFQSWKKFLVRIDGNCAPIQRIVKKIHMSTDISRIKSVFFRKAGQVTAIFIKTGCF